MNTPPDLPIEFVSEKIYKHGAGESLARGWDAAKISFDHPCGKLAHVTFRRWMQDPRNVTWEAHVDGCPHAFGTLYDVQKGEINTCFQQTAHWVNEAAFTQGEHIHEFNSIGRIDDGK